MLQFVLLIFAFLPPLQDKPASQPAKPPVAPAIEDAWKVSIPAFPNPTCPIMGRPISQKLFTDTVRGRIYICCKACIKDIQADVELAYRTAYPKSEKLSNKLCPVTNQPITVESPRVELQGLEFSVLDGNAAKRLTDEAQVALAKLKDPNLVDTGNLTCPVTGEAVAKNTVVIVGKDLIRLSSVKCVESVQKEPKRFLLKAREIRSAQDADAAKSKPASKPASKTPEERHAPSEQD